MFRDAQNTTCPFRVKGYVFNKIDLKAPTNSDNPISKYPQPFEAK